MSQDSLGFPRVRYGLVGFARISQGLTRRNKVAQGLTRSHKVSQGLTWFDRFRCYRSDGVQLRLSGFVVTKRIRKKAVARKRTRQAGGQAGWLHR